MPERVSRLFFSTRTLLPVRFTSPPAMEAAITDRVWDCWLSNSLGSASPDFLSPWSAIEHQLLDGFKVLEGGQVWTQCSETPATSSSRSPKPRLTRVGR